MRPGQNKRMRGRNNNNNSNNNRRGPNPLTRSYESNGPDVKIRGTAHHVGEKYLQLARDAQSSGDPVMAESYLQHAEHYFRLIASAQLAQQQAQFGYQRQPGEQEAEDDGDDDFESLPDRFASPSERVAQAPQQHAPQQQPHQQQAPQQQPQPYEQRAERQPYDNRNGHYQGDRQRQFYDNRGQERNGQERNQQERFTPDRAQQDRSQQDRGQQDRSQQDRQDRGAPNGQFGGERQGRDQNRDYDNRTFRNRQRDDRPRDGQRDGQPYRDQPRQVPDEQPNVGLPAFITAPTRAPVSDEAAQPAASVESPSTAPEGVEDANFHMRPRRRRRPKAEFAGADQGSAGESAPAAVESGEPD